MVGKKRLRAIVCGTTFGRVYLRGLAGLSEDFELAGIVARGSANAHDCAREFGIPLYSSIDDLPDDIDLACVVVRSAVVGGRGTELAVDLLERGIHVMQEHPVHHDEMVECLKAARMSGSRYVLNSFYPDLYSVRRFIKAARRAVKKSKPIYLDVVSGINVLYPMIDILGRIFHGFRPWTFSGPLESSIDDPITSLSGTVAGVPLRLGIQNSMAPEDPDNSGLLLHRFTICTENGTLLLPDTHGPVLWAPRMYVDRRDDGVMDMFGDVPILDMPVMEMQETFMEQTYGDVFSRIWIAAIQRSLVRFRESIVLEGDDRQFGQYCLTACRVWQELVQRLGVARNMELRPPGLERLERAL